MTTESFLQSAAASELPELIELKNKSDCFTHTSFHADTHYTFEAAELPEDYERAEHVGDAFLGFVVTELISNLYPRLTVGTATILKSKLVNNRDSLAHLSVYFGLPSKLLTSKGQREAFRNMPSIQADIFESYVDALRLETGFECSRHFIRAVFTPLVRYHYLLLRKAHYSFAAVQPGEGIAIVVNRKRTVAEIEMDGLPIQENVKRIRLPDDIHTTLEYDHVQKPHKSWICVLENWRVHEKGSKIEYAFGIPAGSLHTPTFNCTCIITRGYAFRTPKVSPPKIESPRVEQKRITMGNEEQKANIEEGEAMEEGELEDIDGQAIEPVENAFEKIGTLLLVKLDEKLMEYEEAPTLIHRSMGTTKKMAKNRSAEGICQLLQIS